LDYPIHQPELRSVGFTAAAKGNASLLAVDATAACLSGGEMQWVFTTEATWEMPT